MLLKASAIFQFYRVLYLEYMYIDSPTLTKVLQVQSLQVSYSSQYSGTSLRWTTAVCLLVGGVILWRLPVYFWYTWQFVTGPRGYVFRAPSGCMAYTLVRKTNKRLFLTMLKCSPQQHSCGSCRQTSV